MPSSFSEYLNNSYDPVSNMIGGWLTEQDAIREARMAELLALEQQRRAAEAATAAQQAQARAAALPLVNPQPVMLPQAPAEAPGVWDQFVNRAVPQSLAGLAGGVGLLGDLIGADSVRDWGLETSKYFNDIAAQTPRTVASLEDVLSGKGDFSTWLKESAIDLAPDLIGTIATGGTGGLAARGGAALAARVAGKELAEETAKKALQRGALAGAYGYGVGAEGGQAYLTDVERHGVEGTSPWMDLATGGVASAFDLAGPAGGLVLRALGRPVSKAASEKLLKTLASEKTRTAILKGLGKGALAEGGTEFLQELTHVINEQLQSPELEWSPRDTMRLIESGILGGIFGAPIGGVSRYRAKQQAPAQLEALLANQAIKDASDISASQYAEERRAAQNYLANLPSNPAPFDSTVDSFYNRTPSVSSPIGEYYAQNFDKLDNFYSDFEQKMKTPTESTAEAATRLRTSMRDAATQVQHQLREESTRLNAEAESLTKQLAKLSSRPPRNVTPEQQRALIADLNKQLVANRAAQVRLQENAKERVSSIQQTLAKEEKKLANKLLDDTIITDQSGLARDPFGASQLIQIRGGAKALFDKQAAAVRERLNKVSTQLNLAERRSKSSQATRSTALAKLLDDQIAAGKKERNELIKRLQKMNGALARIEAGTNNLATTQYTIDQAYVDLQDIYDGGVIDTPTRSEKVLYDTLRKSLDDAEKKRRAEELKARTAARRAKRPTSEFDNIPDTFYDREASVIPSATPFEASVDSFLSGTPSVRANNISQLALTEGQANLPAVSQAIPRGTTSTGRGPIATPFTRDTRPIPMSTRGEDLAIETQAAQEERLLNQWDKDYREQAIADVLASQMPPTANALPEGTPNLPAVSEAIPMGTTDTGAGTIALGTEGGAIPMGPGREQLMLPEGAQDFDRTPDNFYGTTPEVKGFVESNPDIKSPMISRFPEAVDAFYNYTPDIVEGTWLMTDATTKPVKAKSPKESAKLTPKDKSNLDVTRAVADEDYRQAVEDVRHAAIRLESTSKHVDKKSWTKKLNEGLVKAKQALNKLLNLNIEQLRTNADTPSKKLVTQGITPSLEMLPLLSHNVTIVDSVDVPEAAGRTGYITRDQKIYLVADNIVAEAKQRKKSVKEIATRTLVHEGLAHYGLRAIMSPAELGNFLHDFRRKFENTPTWKRVAASIPEFDQLNKRQQAEEVFAKLSERYKINNLLESRNLAKGYLNSFIKKLDSKLGLTDLTLDDVKSLLTVAADRLSMESAGQDAADIGAHYRTIPQTGLARSLDPNLESMTRVERAEAEAAQRFPFSNRIQEAIANRDDTVEYVREKLVDSFRPLERMIQAVKGMGKKADGTSRVTWDTNVYKLNQHLPSQQALALERYKTNMVDPLVDFIGQTALPGEDYRVTFARVSDYVEAVSAYERNDFGAKKGLDFPLVPGKKGKSLQESQDYYRNIIKQYGSPAMDKVMDQLQKINNERLRLLEEKKIIPKEVIDNWKAAYKYYMPFKSWENVVQELDPAWYNSSTRKSLSTPNIQKKIMHRATGREGEAQNPIIHSILQLYDVSNLTRTVDIGRSLLRLVKNNPDATHLFEMVEYRDKNDKDWGKPRLTTDPETGEQVYVIDHGAMKRIVNNKTGDISLVPTKHTAEGEMRNTVAVIDEDGNVQRVLLHDSGVARALRAENIARASGVVRAIGAIQHELGKYMTSRNPLFWITNPIRDTVTAAINISSLKQELEALGIPNSKEISQAILVNGLGKALTKNSVRNALMYFRKYGTFDDVKGAKSGLSDEMKMYMSDYEQYLNYGGQTEYFGTNTYETLKKDILSTLKDKNPKTFLEKQRVNVNNMMKYMDEVSNSLENMTRYIAFKEIVDRLKPYAEAGRTADNRPFSYEEMYSRAANIALNLTVNFSRKGSWAPIFNSLYMFASASIGGNVRMLETIFRKDRKTGKPDWNHVAKFAAYPLAAYTLQAIIARALMGDDDDGISFYDKIPEYVKSGNIIIPNPASPGDYITIPLPYGFDIFWNLAMNIYEALHSAVYGNPGPSAIDAASSSIGKMFNNFATIGGTDEGWTSFIPSIVRPLWQLSQNKNFAGNPIMPTGNENLRGEIPDHEKYWSTANPSLVWMTKALSPIIDVSPESVEHLANAYLGGLGRITFGLLGRLDEFARGKDIDVGKVPGLKVLYKTTQDSDTSALFSKMRTNVLTQINAVDTARTDMRLTPEEKRVVLMDNLQGYRLKPTLNKLQQQLNLLREQERKLMNNPSISSGAKAKRLEQINQLKQRTMKKFIKAANEAGITG